MCASGSQRGRTTSDQLPLSAASIQPQPISRTGFGLNLFSFSQGRGGGGWGRPPGGDGAHARWSMQGPRNLHCQPTTLPTPMTLAAELTFRFLIPALQLRNVVLQCQYVDLAERCRHTRPAANIQYFHSRYTLDPVSQLRNVVLIDNMFLKREMPAHPPSCKFPYLHSR